MMRNSRSAFHWSLLLGAVSSWLTALFTPDAAVAQVLNKQQMLQAETFWDNRDFDWYASNIPFFDCPDRDIKTTYYYRWDLLTKHLTYGSPNSGYSFTEFIDRPFWSGAFGAISCPAGHQLYEARWLRSPRIANDYSRYWFRTPGAQPRNYSTWLADSIREVDKVHPNRSLLIDLLPDLVSNYEAWEQRQFVPEVGLFWQTGHDDGMEFNINSRQTQDILRGAPSYRPSFNAYMWADATAIAKIATLAQQPELAAKYQAKADSLKAKMIQWMWDERRQFFFPVLKNDEQRDGHTLKALTRTYESGKYAGDSHGRELIGYVPWQFNLFQSSTPTNNAGDALAAGDQTPIATDRRFDVAWKKLIDRDGFYADFGPSTVERNDPMFLLQNSCCWWSGQSWPYATTQTLKALANFIQGGGTTLNSAHYLDLLSIYARSHRKDGKPYLAEALHPDTGSFEGHDGYNHSEHYFHSGYCDLVITGLVGLVTRDDDTLEIKPLAPGSWDYFALDDVPYRGRLISVVWDKLGTRYGLGKGFHVLVDGKQLHRADTVQPLMLKNALPIGPTKSEATSAPVDINFAVNNEGRYYPRLTASSTAEGTSIAKVHDGNFWYLRHPPNRWESDASDEKSAWLELDLGIQRPINEIKLLVLDDRDRDDSNVRAPAKITVQSWNGSAWETITPTSISESPTGHRPHVLKLSSLAAQKLRFELTCEPGMRVGLTEIEVWGPAELPLAPLPPPAGNLAYNDGSQRYPKATASYHDRFGGVPTSAIDGITNFLPTPTNRWTSYESPNETDWLEIDFGKQVEFRRVELGIYDDRGGVQRPERYELEVWDGSDWQPVSNVAKSPKQPAGSQWNTATFDPVTTSKLRIQFTNWNQARSGVTEVMVWN